MNYLFVPFGSNENNSELLSMGTKWIENAQEDSRGKTPPRLLSYNLRLHKPLNVIGQHDTVYVLAHGHQNLPNFIANVRAMVCLALDHSTLATRLRVAGLPLNHGPIKLYICNSSGNMNQFAADFKNTMTTFGYNNIDVHYYGTSVSIPNEFADGLYHKDGAQFDTNGQLIITPRFRASDVRHQVP